MQKIKDIYGSLKKSECTNIITEVVNSKIKYSRSAQLTLIDNKVIFDTSDEEYGPYEFDLDFLIRKIEKHKKKLNESKQII